MGFDVWIGPAIVAATIAAAINVLGWVVTARRDRARASARRVEQQNDISTALLSEIAHYRDVLVLFDLDEAWSQVVGQMEADHTFMPFVPSERNDTIFRAILPEIHVLPQPVVMPVTRYYNQVFAIEMMIADLRSDVLNKAPQDKRIAAYTDYISLKKEALVASDDAIKALDVHLSVTRTGSGLTSKGGR